jgi:hypothetical protein
MSNTATYNSHNIIIDQIINYAVNLENYSENDENILGFKESHTHKIEKATGK